MTKKTKSASRKILKFLESKKLKTVGLTTSMTTAMTQMAFATATGTQEKLISSLGGIITDMFMYIGIFLLIVSIGQVVMAQRNEDAEGKTKAIQQALVSVFLITIKAIVNIVLSATGTGVTL